MVRIKVLFATAMALAVAVSCVRADEAQEKPIRELMSAYVDAFNAGDATKLGTMWLESGVHVDRATGERTAGRQAIVESLGETFARSPRPRLQIAIDEVRLVRPDVARVEGTSTLTGTTEDEPSVASVSALVVKHGEQWLLDTVDETPPASPESAEMALAPLAFLIGAWQENPTEEGASASAQSVFRWSPKRAFLIRSFSGANIAGDDVEGTQVIGWDPRRRVIRSWTFFSDGGFGEGEWSRKGDEWSIASTQTLADGRIATGTFALSRVDADTLSIQLVGHEVEGEPVPTQPAVTAKRVASGATSAVVEKPNPMPVPATKPPTQPAPAKKGGGQ